MREDSSNVGTSSVPLIRAATPADFAGVEQLLTESKLPVEGVRDVLAGFVVAEAAGAIVGVAGLEVCCEHALLRSVAVTPAWRSKGLGRALVTHLIAEAEARGIPALYLLTTTAERYFPSLGFEQISRDEVPADVQTSGEYRSVCPTTATVMRRPSKQPAPAHG